MRLKFSCQKSYNPVYWGCRVQRRSLDRSSQTCLRLAQQQTAQKMRQNRLCVYAFTCQKLEALSTLPRFKRSLLFFSLVFLSCFSLLFFMPFIFMPFIFMLLFFMFLFLQKPEHNIERLDNTVRHKTPAPPAEKLRALHYACAPCLLPILSTPKSMVTKTLFYALRPRGHHFSPLFPFFFFLSEKLAVEADRRRFNEKTQQPIETHKARPSDTPHSSHRPFLSYRQPFLSSL